jgi:hypothetical protein
MDTMEDLTFRINEFIEKQQSRGLIPKKIQELVHRSGKSFVRTRTVFVKPEEFGIKLTHDKTIDEFENIYDTLRYIRMYGARKSDIPEYDTKNRLSQSLERIKNFKGYHWDEIRNALNGMIKGISMKRSNDEIKQMGDKIVPIMDHEAEQIAKIKGVQPPTDSWYSEKSRYGWIKRR